MMKNKQPDVSAGEVTPGVRDQLPREDITNRRTPRRADSPFPVLRIFTYIPFNWAWIAVIFAITSIFLKWKMDSDNHFLLQQIEVLNQLNHSQSSRIDKLKADMDELKADSNKGRVNSNAQLREYQMKVDALDSEKQQLREQITILSEQNSRQLSLLEKLQTGTKDQRDNLDAKLREYNIKMDAVNSENRILREQIAFANRHSEFLKSQMDKKERNAQTSSVRLHESQFDEKGAEYLIKCLGQEESSSETFTGLNVFWGGLKLGYTTKNSLDNCLQMYNAIYKQKISYK